MSSKVRIVRSQALHKIRKLEALCFPGEELEHVHDQIWFIGYCEGKAVCYAGLQVWAADFGFMSRAGVAPEFRGQGLQKRLIKARERYARKIGLQKLITYTSPANPSSMNSLIGAGMRTYEPAYPWVGDDWVYWYKKL